MFLVLDYYFGVLEVVPFGCFLPPGPASTLLDFHQAGAQLFLFVYEVVHVQNFSTESTYVLLWRNSWRQAASVVFIFVLPAANDWSGDCWRWVVLDALDKVQTLFHFWLHLFEIFLGAFFIAFARDRSVERGRDPLRIVSIGSNQGCLYSKRRLLRLVKRFPEFFRLLSDVEPCSLIWVPSGDKCWVKFVLTVVRPWFHFFYNKLSIS